MSEHIVETRHGRVRGEDIGGAVRFLGIPYGAPTGGQNRFKAPQPPYPWAGVRDATAPAPVAPQAMARPGTRPDTTAAMSEDCLTVNVWTSDVRGAKPVLVWFHGGGFAVGQALAPHNDGTQLAVHHDVVVVSVTHRLALLGFLHLEEIGGEEYSGSGNASLLDLQAALEWVRDNIAAFGGDPDAVTIHGHSGGGGKVAAVASMPSARGLFRSAIVHGGPPFGFKDRAAAGDTAGAALALLGSTASDLSALHEASLDQLLQVQWDLGVHGGPGPHGMRLAPTIGTAVLPADPYQSFAAGAGRSVTLMTGTALDEARAAVTAFPHYLTDADMSEAELIERVRPGLDDPADAEILIGRYRELDLAARNRDIFFDLSSDQFTIRSLRLADAKQLGDGEDSWVYLCTANQSSDARAFHGIEMPLFFGTADADSPAYAVAASVSAELARFVAGDLAASEHWRPYRRGDPEQLVIGDVEITSRRAPHAERIALWDGVIVTPRSDPWTTLWE
jgi:para-nitrobenzyl esterase